MKKAPARAASAILAAAAVVATISGPSASAATPEFSYSYYMKGCTNAQAESRGCSLGSGILGAPNLWPVDGFVVLHFGAPVHGNNYQEQGATGFATNSSQYLDTETIRTRAQRFAKGWWDCGGASVSGAQLRIAIGTSNNTLATAPGWTSQIASSHGNHWASMVQNANGWASSNPASGPRYGTKIIFLGAMDMEVAWSGLPKLQDWVTAYRDYWNGQPSTYRLVDTGSADGCPDTWDEAGLVYAQCASAGSLGTIYWGMDDRHWLAWDSGITSPAPQIYRTDAKNAKQWRWVSQWGVTFTLGPRINFYATSSQSYACTQPGHGCSIGTDNTPGAAWNQLTNWINCTIGPSTPCDTPDSIRWSTDWRWLNA